MHRIRPQTEGFTAEQGLLDARLRLAVEDGNLDAIDGFLRQGADPDVPGPDGMTATLIAEFAGNRPISDLIEMHRAVRNRLSSERNARPTHWEHTPSGFTVAHARRLLKEAVGRAKKPAGGDNRLIQRLARSLAAVDSPEAVDALGELLRSKRDAHRLMALQAWGTMDCPRADEALKQLASFWTMGRHSDKIAARRLLRAKSDSSAR